MTIEANILVMVGLDPTIQTFFLSDNSAVWPFYQGARIDSPACGGLAMTEQVREIATSRQARLAMTDEASQK